MKFAFMSFTCPTADLPAMLSLAKTYGYDGVEPRAQAEHKHGVEITASAEQRREIRRTLAGNGIACACIATSIRYCFADPGPRAKQISVTKKFIDLAQDLGCARIRVFCGMPDRRMDEGEAVEIVGEALTQVKAQAEQARVAVCLETHDFMMRAELVAQTVRLVKSNYIRANWDIMHPFTKGLAVEDAYAILKGLIGHCHVHDGTYDEKRNPTLALMGEGEIPHDTAVRLLAADGYDGYLSGEYIDAWKPEVVLPHEIRTLKSYLP